MNKPLALIDGFEHLTAQQCVQMSYDHIHSTGKISRGPSGCTYAGSGCAAAVFIKPEYREQLDKAGNWLAVLMWEEKHNRNADFLLAHTNADIIKGLQGCHDSWSKADENRHPGFMVHFDARMRALCERFDLVYPGDTPCPLAS